MKYLYLMISVFLLIAFLMVKHQNVKLQYQVSASDSLVEYIREHDHLFHDLYEFTPEYREYELSKK